MAEGFISPQRKHFGVMLLSSALIFLGHETENLVKYMSQNKMPFYGVFPIYHCCKELGSTSGMLSDNLKRVIWQMLQTSVDKCNVSPLGRVYKLIIWMAQKLFTYIYIKKQLQGNLINIHIINSSHNIAPRLYIEGNFQYSRLQKVGVI